MSSIRPPLSVIEPSKFLFSILILFVSSIALDLETLISIFFGAMDGAEGLLESSCLV